MWIHPADQKTITPLVKANSSSRAPKFMIAGRRNLECARKTEPPGRTLKVPRPFLAGRSFALWLVLREISSQRRGVKARAVQKLWRRFATHRRQGSIALVPFT
jgi:hypothetical protein